MIIMGNIGDVEMGWSILGTVRKVVGTVVSVPGKVITKAGQIIGGGGGGGGSSAPTPAPEPEGILQGKKPPVALLVGGGIAVLGIGYLLLRKRRPALPAAR